MINANRIILEKMEKMTYKERLILHIIDEMDHLNLLEYHDGPHLHIIENKIEEELQKKNEHELFKFLMNENDEMQSIHSEMKAKEEAEEKVKVEEMIREKRTVFFVI